MLPLTDQKSSWVQDLYRLASKRGEFSCSEARRDTSFGHYERKLQAKAGEVRLKVPKLRAQTFETAIITGDARARSRRP